MSFKWNDIMELEFSQRLDGREYDDVGSAIVGLARAAYAVGFQHAVLIQEANATAPIVTNVNEDKTLCK